jgi:hypothetical protein
MQVPKPSCKRKSTLHSDRETTCVFADIFFTKKNELCISAGMSPCQQFYLCCFADAKNRILFYVCCFADSKNILQKGGCCFTGIKKQVPKPSCKMKSRFYIVTEVFCTNLSPKIGGIAAKKLWCSFVGLYYRKKRCHKTYFRRLPWIEVTTEI